MTTGINPDPDAATRRSLARFRLFATGLLLAMAALTLASYALPAGEWADWLQASAKAGFVGGIADWFAVVALFRHPLGLPIPHTAIIPAQKARLGQALGRFVANHVFTPDEVARVLRRLDLPMILQSFLADPVASRPAAEAVARLLPRVLASVEDGRARRVVARVLPRLLGGAGAGRVVARALRGLVEGGRHQEMLGFVLVRLKAAMAGKEDQLRQIIEDRVREQGGRLVGWALGASVARRVLATVTTEMERIGTDNSDLRAAFDEWVNREIVRLEEDPARAAEMGLAIRRLVAHDTVQAWIWDVWARLRAALEDDASRPNGHAIGLIEGAFANLGAVLAADEEARGRLASAAEKVAASLLPSARAQLAEFIGSVVAGWDTGTIVDRIELRVGRDLQYVRVNGTIVGFLVGGILYVGLRAAFGHVSF